LAFTLQAKNEKEFDFSLYFVVTNLEILASMTVKISSRCRIEYKNTNTAVTMNVKKSKIRNDVKTTFA